MSSGDAAIWDEVKVQRLLLPYGVHQGQSLHANTLNKNTSRLHTTAEVHLQPDLNNQHVLSEVISLFEDDSHR